MTQQKISRHLIILFSWTFFLTIFSYAGPEKFPHLNHLLSAEDAGSRAVPAKPTSSRDKDQTVTSEALMNTPDQSQRLEFSEKSKVAIVGTCPPWVINFSSRMVEQGVVEVNIGLKGNKKLAAHFDYGQEEFKIQFIALETGELVQLTAEDLRTFNYLGFRFISTIHSYGNRQNVADALLSTIGLVYDVPVGKYLDLSFEDISRVTKAADALTFENLDSAYRKIESLPERTLSLSNGTVAKQSIQFSENTRRAIVGIYPELEVSFSSTMVEEGVVEVEVLLKENRKLMAYHDRAREKIKIQFISSETGELIRFTDQDLQTLRALWDELSRQPLSGVQQSVVDALLNTVGLLYHYPAGEFFDYNSEDHSLQDSSEKSIRSLCGQIGSLVEGTYDIIEGQPISVSRVIGPCLGKNCLGRCGPNCGVPPRLINPNIYSGLF